MAQTTKRTRGPRKLKSFNPRTGERIGEVPASTKAEVLDAVAAARKVAPEWGALDPRGRAHVLKAVRQNIYSHLDEVVETIARECGKPRAEALSAEVLQAVISWLYLERTAGKNLRSERLGGIFGYALGLSTKAQYRPYGVIGAITPWNYPFGLAMAAIGPALFAGNTIVLKPSEVTPGVGEVVKSILEPLPPGVATVVQGAGNVGAALVDAPCDKICFIGSPETGRKIAAAAATHLTPVVMELGGKDAAIVCSDADLDLASSGIVWGAFVNAGQTCAAIERVYVVDSVADEFSTLFLDKLKRLRQGGRDSDVGSLTFKKQFDAVARHVTDAVGKGARVLAGGPDVGPRNKNGSLWYAPTVIEGVTDDMEAMQQETFGPLVPLIRVQDEDEAIRRANEDSFNLTASVWTRNGRRGEVLAGRVRAGSVVVNAHGEQWGSAWAPWGGVGESGYGRINGRLGLHEFVYPVTIGRNSMPRLKRLWWYPYDDDTAGVFRYAVEVLAAPKWAEKLGHAPEALKSLRRALKAKF
jgi:acyl-CoA reductase-like NAD-dependent aldehyde dehydrogenase